MGICSTPTKGLQFFVPHVTCFDGLYNCGDKAVIWPWEGPIPQQLTRRRSLFKSLYLLAGAWYFCVGPAHAADMFVYQSASGAHMITNHPRVKPGYRLIKVYSEAGGWREPSTEREASVNGTSPSGYDELIEHAARAARLDPLLVKSVMHAESAFDPDAVSDKGASGLMQLMPHTARRYGVLRIFDPRENVVGGARYLRDLLDRFDGRVALALAGYNAGENAVLERGGIPPYEETRRYVNRVMQLYRQYRADQCEQQVKGRVTVKDGVANCSTGGSVGGLDLSLPDTLSSIENRQ